MRPFLRHAISRENRMEEGNIDPNVYLQQIAIRMKADLDREEMEHLLDDLERIYDILDVDTLDGAEALMAQLRRRLGLAA
jgi:hypothetical protein